MRLRLVAPAVGYRDTFLAALAEFRREGLPWWLGAELELAERDFPCFVALKLEDALPRDTRVAKTHLWAISDDTFVGRIAVHHRLDDALRRCGGHIGYDTVPSFRRLGVASEMLRQALPVARQLGLRETLLTCDPGNTGSIRVIEANGGVLRETVCGASGERKRHYWIEV